ncbi:MAG TPA: FAD-dependent oxidoreductase [Candidatus Polarisedimenticolia bacterium]|nr:FAD-dependent oxidoreductase [Candidatus Polarisedimenticolia bacterium]
MHDVAIIGGGPAGSTAAALLAAAGRDVVLFEKERFPRFHIGESLLPYNLDLFRRLGVLEALEGRFVEKWGARLYCTDGSTNRYVEFKEGFVPGHPYAFQVLRSEFDTMLLNNARAKGAQVHEATRVVEAAPSARDGCRLTIRRADGTLSEETARFLLDASGRDAFMAGKRSLRDMTPHLRKAAVFAHYEGIPRGEGRYAGDIVMVVLRDGWIWMIPLPEGRTSVGLVMEGSTLRQLALPPEKLLEEALRRAPAAHERVKNARRVSEVYSASDYSYECREIAGDGYLLLGDAAAFIDPIFSTGVWLAMSSGEMAADALHAALGTSPQAADLSPRVFADFARKVRHHVRTYTRIVSRFYEPGFMDIFLRPSARFRVRESVISLLAGNSEPSLAVRLRLAYFYSVLRIHRRFRLTPPVTLYKVLEGPPA